MARSHRSRRAKHSRRSKKASKKSRKVKKSKTRRSRSVRTRSSIAGGYVSDNERNSWSFKMKEKVKDTYHNLRDKWRNRSGYYDKP